MTTVECPLPPGIAAGKMTSCSVVGTTAGLQLLLSNHRSLRVELVQVRVSGVAAAASDGVRASQAPPTVAADAAKIARPRRFIRLPASGVTPRRSHVPARERAVYYTREPDA